MCSQFCSNFLGGCALNFRGGGLIFWWGVVVEREVKGGG